ncbi:MAG: putative 3-oxoacyl-[acyl-carrier-protein] reductase [Marmoricola sp.]|nr:putative 3-oxoacyl-[acyl-carrier-protein] reductase [Marmoricola sp.]
MADRTALVTGASRGIGLGIATHLAGLGFALTITARDAAVLEDVSRSLRAAGAPDVLAVASEASDADAVAAVVDAHAARWSSLSTLVLGAGVGSAGPVADYPLARWDKQFAVNVRAAFVAVARALPLLRHAAGEDAVRGARIIALSSIGGVYPEPGLAAYGASKAALISLCRSLNEEESGHGVSATAISPAYVDTDMSAWVHDEVPPEEMIPVSDVVALVGALVEMSSRSVVPHLVVSRAGASGYRA